MFDFDRTLTTKHVGVFDLNSSSCINGHSNDDVAEKVFGGSGRVSMLHHMLETLEARAPSSTCERNSAYVVKKALAAVGLTYIQSVIGDDELQETPHRLDPKSEIIRKRLLGEAAGQADGPHLLFVDDDVANVKDVRAAIEGATVIHVKEKGMGRQDVDAVYEWLAQTERHTGVLSQQIAAAASEPLSPRPAPN